MQLNVVKIDWKGRTATLNFVRDVTDQLNLEASLRQAQKMEAIGTLAGGIAHDFNNLLMGIQGRISLMMFGMEAGHPFFEHLSRIEDCVKNATDLTRQLLGFARGGKYEIKPTRMNDILDQSIEMFGRTRKEIQIHKNYEAQSLDSGGRPGTNASGAVEFIRQCLAGDARRRKSSAANGKLRHSRRHADAR